MPNMDQDDEGIGDDEMINSPTYSMRAVFVFVDGHGGGIGWYIVIRRELRSHPKKKKKKLCDLWLKAMLLELCDDRTSCHHSSSCCYSCLGKRKPKEKRKFCYRTREKMRILLLEGK